MGKITLSEVFSIIPEGTHIFKIVEVNYKESFGKLEIKMKTAKGQVHTERFTLLKQDGSANEGALSAFSYFARAALNDFSAQDVNPQDLVGHFIECDVEHDSVESKKNPDRLISFARLTEKRPADGYDEVEVASPVAKSATGKKPDVKAGEIDLDDLLG